MLIVEDNKSSMKLFDGLTKSLGHRTIQAIDGAEVMNVVRKHHPDLIIMDIQLPNVSGLKLTKSIKADEKLNPIPVFAVTAFAMDADEAKCRQAGCEGYMTKPINRPAFINNVNEFLTRSEKAARV